MNDSSTKPIPTSRVLAVTSWFPTAQKPVSGLFNKHDVELLSRNHQITVLHLDSNIKQKTLETESNYQVIRFPFSFKNPLDYLKLSKYIKKNLQKYDVIHSMAFPSLVALITTKIRRPWVHTEHYSELLNKQSGFYSFLTKILMRLFKRPKQIVAVSQALKQKIDHQLKSGSNTTVIYNYVQFPKMQNSSNSALLQQGNRFQAPLKLVAVGGLIERKGPEQAVEAIKLLNEWGIKTDFTWVGSGPLKDKLQKKVSNLNLETTINFVGTKTPAEVSKLLTQSDMFLLPVKNETFGVAIAEALAHGLAVSTSGDGGHLDFLPDKASRYVTPRTPSQIAESIKSLLNDEKLWSREEIKEYARNKFSEDNRKEEYAVVYKAACNSI